MALINTITTDVHNPVVVADRFKHIVPATTVELIMARYIAVDQFMTHCWSLSFDYDEYVFHAKRLEYRVYDAVTYKDHCASQEEQMAAFYA